MMVLMEITKDVQLDVPLFILNGYVLRVMPLTLLCVAQNVEMDFELLLSIVTMEIQAIFQSVTQLVLERYQAGIAQEGMSLLLPYVSHNVVMGYKLELNHVMIQI